MDVLAYLAVPALTVVVVWFVRYERPWEDGLWSVWWQNRRDWIAYLLDRTRGRKLCGHVRPDHVRPEYRLAYPMPVVQCDRPISHQGPHMARKNWGPNTPSWYRRGKYRRWLARQA